MKELVKQPGKIFRILFVATAILIAGISMGKELLENNNGKKARVLLEQERDILEKAAILPQN